MDKQERDKETYSRNYDQEEPSPRRLNFRESLGDDHHKGKPHHASYSRKQDSQPPYSFRGFHRLLAPSRRGSPALDITGAKPLNSRKSFITRQSKNKSGHPSAAANVTSRVG